MVIDDVYAFQGEVEQWRRQLHSRPGILYEVEETAEFVRQKLESFGVDQVVSGIGRTGVVGIIKGRHEGNKVVGLRAELDALPLSEMTNAPWRSIYPGKMHACGHDGHTAMLLGAARHLAATREFAGTVALIFQPAEEGGKGAAAMIDDGLLECFRIAEVYTMHNMPGLAVGKFGIREGVVLAASDNFRLTINGRGSHAAEPHKSSDPIAIGVQVVSMLNSIISRNIDPLKSAVLSVAKFHSGTTYNVIPESAEIMGTVRTLDEEVREVVEAKLRNICKAAAVAHDVVVDVEFEPYCSATINGSEETGYATAAARAVVGTENVIDDIDPMMGAEDFAYMLEKRPGALIWIGNGESPALHSPLYDFDDRALPFGVSYWVTLVGSRLSG
ncbi:M20 aminoacylase family protein [Mesorhizobium sp. M0047]|uniref:M20 aminoacylase family protein n=1 Tax=Mesorhizobium sp. M0047 TaxID=2956859 RepID=UPI003335E8FE